MRRSCYNKLVSTDSFGPKLQAALERRSKLAADPRTNAYRLINRAADGFPDLAVDRYANVLVAHLYTHGQRTAPPKRLLEALAAETGAEAVYIKYRPDQSSVLDEEDRHELAPTQPLFGRATDELEEVARSVGNGYRLERSATAGIYEQVLEFTVPADGRYALRVEGGLAYDPVLPALQRNFEIAPQVFVEFLDPATG